MGLVDGEEGQGDAREAVQKARGEDAFGGDVEQVETTGHELGLHLAGPGRVQGGIEAGRAHAVLGQALHLVAHEGDERGDDDGRAGTDQGRDLVAQGLAPARGHEDHGVPAGQDGLDDRLLGALKGVVAENRTEDFKGRGHGKTSGRLLGPGFGLQDARSLCQSAVRAQWKNADPT
ncbi:hypothetical protein DSECCO2_568610 [anaerobic digester metagenome]